MLVYVKMTWKLSGRLRDERFFKNFSLWLRVFCQILSLKITVSNNAVCI